MMYFRCKLALFMALVTCLPIYVQEVAQSQDLPKVVARTNRSRIQIADPFELRIEVTSEAESEVQFPSVESMLGNFEVIDHKDFPAIPTGADLQTKQWIRVLTLETLETGNLEVPSTEILVDLDNGSSKRIATETLPVFVESSVEEGSDPTKFNDIRDVVDLKVPETKESGSWVYWSVATALGLLTAGTTLFAVSRRKHWKTPAQWATSQLSAPELSMGEIESVFRTYLEKEFDVTASSMPNCDVETFVSGIGCNEAQNEFLSSFFSTLNQCKYAEKKVTDATIDEFKNEMLGLISSLEEKNQEVE